MAGTNKGMEGRSLEPIASLEQPTCTCMRLHDLSLRTFIYISNVCVRMLECELR